MLLSVEDEEPPALLIDTVPGVGKWGADVLKTRMGPGVPLGQK